MQVYRNGKNYPISELEYDGGSGIGDFFNSIGNTIKSVGSKAVSTVGNELKGVASKAANDFVKQGVNQLTNQGLKKLSSLTQNPEVALKAAAGGAMRKTHLKYFNSELDKEIGKQSGGFFDVKSLAKKAYSSASKSVNKELKNASNTAKNAISNEYQSRIKPDLLQAKNQLLTNANDEYNKGYSVVQRKVKNSL